MHRSNLYLFTLLMAIFNIAIAQDLTLFEYERPVTEARLDLVKEKNNYFVYKGLLDATDPISKKSYSIYFDYYKTKIRNKAPLVIVFPSLSNEIPLVENLIAQKLANKGYHAIIAKLTEDIADLNRPIQDIDKFFIRTTVSFRMVLDKALLWREIESDNVYSIGVSLGGIRSAIALGVEPRLKAAALYVAGGDLSEIIATSKVKLITNYKEHWKKKLGIQTDNEFEELIRAHNQIDPLIYAPLRSREEVFMVLGTRDDKVPYKNQLLLWNALGKPEKIEIRKKHRITGASFMVNFNKVIRFFENFN